MATESETTEQVETEQVITRKRGTRKVATRKVALRSKKKTGYIKHGSVEHSALLGIDRQSDLEEKAKLQEALDAGVPPVMSDKAGGVNRRTYPQQGQIKVFIHDGWYRQGR